MKKKLMMIQLAAFVILIAADQLIKICVERYLKPIGTHVLIPGVIRLYYTKNTGAAFGSFAAYTGILIMVNAVIIAAGITYMLKSKNKAPVISIFLPLILAGGVGNQIDRVFRGYVIDYLDFTFVNFAVFNFADCLVTVSVCVLIAYFIYEIYKDSKKGVRI